MASVPLSSQPDGLALFIHSGQFAIPTTLKRTLLLSFALHLGLLLLLQLLSVRQAGTGLEGGRAARMQVQIRQLPSPPAARATSAQATAMTPTETVVATDANPPATDNLEIAPDREGRWGIELPGSDEYYPVATLTEKPRVIQNIPENIGDFIPPEVEGKVILRLYLSPTGLVDDVAVEETELAVNDLGLLLHSFRQARFQPGKLGGIAVKSELRIEVSISKPLAP